MFVLTFLEGIAGCGDTQYTCLDGSCITSSRLCDSSNDCPNSEDEDPANCPTPSPGKT